MKNNNNRNQLTGEDKIKNLTESFTYDKLNRLTSSHVAGQDAITLKYKHNGNISSKSDVGEDDYTYKYGENGAGLHAVTSISGITTGTLQPRLRTSILPQQDITYTSFNKIATITQDENEMQFTYGTDNLRRKTQLYNDGELVKTKYYVGNYEKEITGSNTRELHYIYGGDGLAAVLEKKGTSKTMYYVSKDYLGSPIILTKEDGTIAEQYNFDAWGNRRNPSNWSYTNVPTSYLIDRGFTFHEHMDKFGLVNMNGRLYDPEIGRMLSPDNYVQMPDFTQNFNRYSYCLNNPLKFTDPDGEWFGIAFLIGGVVNLGVNLWQGNIDNFGEGLAAFGAGGAAGTLALYGPAGWAAGGAIVGGTNAWIGGATSFGDIAMGAGVGAFSGVVGGAVGQYAAQGLGGVVINGFNITSPVAKGVIGGAIGGAAGGYAGGFTGGLLMTGDISAAHQAGMSGMITGAPIGGVAGGVGGYAAAKKAGINPWNGKYNKSIVLGRDMAGRVNPSAGDLNAETITNDWNAEFGDGRVSDSKGLSFNRKWLNGKINDGYHIYDIGNGGLPNGKYYGLEQKLMLNQSCVSKTFYWSNSKFRFVYYGN